MSQFSMCNGWEKIKGNMDEWNEEERPGNEILDYYKLTLEPNEIAGILTDRIIVTGQSCLGRIPGSQGFVYTKLKLIGKNISDISILQHHRYLQCIDLSWNCLTDVSALGHVRYLCYLDVSHNQLKKVLNFRAPNLLLYADYSYNNVDRLDDLSAFWSLKTLNLSHNYINKITGLLSLRYLLDLDLSYNQIRCLENLHKLSIMKLNLEGNHLNTFERNEDLSMSTLHHLRYLNLNNNYFTTLEFLKGVFSLRCLEMNKNRLTRLVEIDYVKFMIILEEVTFKSNPISFEPKYRELIIFTLPSLISLDGISVLMAEKESAMNIFDPSIYEIAAKNFNSLLIHSIKNPVIGDDVIPADQPPHPLIVLVGPFGIGKIDVIKELVAKHEKIHFGVPHTTLDFQQTENDEEEVEYHPVTIEKFNEMHKNGEFLSISQDRGNFYGREEFAKAVRKQCICITHMELCQAITLSLTDLRPCFILCMCKTTQIYLDRLAIKYQAIRADGGALVLRRGGKIDSLPTPQPSISILKESNSGLVQSSITNTCSTTSTTPILQKSTSTSYVTKSVSFTSSTNTSVKESQESTKNKSTCSLSLIFDDSRSKTSSKQSGSADSRSVLFTHTCPNDPPRNAWTGAIIKSLQAYLGVHEEEPQFFETSINMDSLNSAYKDLHRWMKEFYQTRKPHLTYSPEDDPFYESMVMGKVKRFDEMIERRKSINEQHLHDVINVRPKPSWMLNPL